MLGLLSSNSYELIADEYYKPRHVTSRNFDSATREYLSKADCALPDNGYILDIGAGRGNVMNYCGIQAHRIVQADKSRRMLLISPREPSLGRTVGDALVLPFQREMFAGVAAFLYDPFNVPSFYTELSRIVKPNGAFLGTLPSLQWGQILRGIRGYNINKTRLITDSGQSIERDSYLMAHDEVRSHLLRASFSQVEIKDVCLPRGEENISPDLSDAAAAMGVSSLELPFLTIVQAWR